MSVLCSLVKSSINCRKKTLVEKLAQRKLQESKGPVHLLHVPLPNNISEARDNYANI